MFVYKITNIINNKVYIGITKNIKSRFAYHKTRFNKQNKKEYLEKPLYKAFRKYGIENFKFEVLFENLTDEEAANKEIELIAEYKSLSHENGYNITKGGNYRAIKGEEVNTAVLTEQDVLDIRNRVSNGETIKNVYKDYKHLISESGFQAVYSNKTWKHLPKAVKHLPSGASIDTDTVNKIREMYKNGTNPRQISIKLDIEYKKCWRICTNQTYKHL